MGRASMLVNMSCRLLDAMRHTPRQDSWDTAALNPGARCRADRELDVEPSSPGAGAYSAYGSRAMRRPNRERVQQLERIRAGAERLGQRLVQQAPGFLVAVVRWQGGQPRALTVGGALAA